MRLARGDTVDQGTFNNNIRCIEIFELCVKLLN